MYVCSHYFFLFLLSNDFPIVFVFVSPIINRSSKQLFLSVPGSLMLFICLPPSQIISNALVLSLFFFKNFLLLISSCLRVKILLSFHIFLLAYACINVGCHNHLTSMFYTVYMHISMYNTHTHIQRHTLTCVCVISL